MDNHAFKDSEENVEKNVSFTIEKKNREVERTVSEETVALKKEVGLISGIAYIVGCMIGSGIFVSPGGLLAETGSVGASLIIWTACGLLSTLASLAYIELGTVVPSSGAEYAYILVALGSYPAFLYSWVTTLILNPSSFAIITLAFAQYTIQGLSTVVNVEAIPSVVTRLLAAIAIVIITYVNCNSVKWANKVQVIFTVAKLIAIGVIICIGIYQIVIGKTQYLATGFAGSTTSPAAIATAFYSGLWAYSGWNTLNFITEELKNPYRNLPLAILIALPLVTICYLAVNISYLTLLSPAEIVSSQAIAVSFGDRILGAASFTMPLAVVFSTFGAANGGLFVAGRLSYAASRQGHLIQVLSYINIHNYTPSIALMFNAVLALFMIIPGNISTLINIFSFCSWIFYGGAMIAFCVLRRTMRDAPRPFKVPLVVPILVLLISVYLVAAPIIDNPEIEYIYALSFIFAGTFFYVPFVHYKKQLPTIDKLTEWIQLLFNVVPPEDELKIL